MISACFTLRDDNCKELVQPHVARLRAEEIENELRCIHGQFVEEQGKGLPELERNMRAWTTLHEREELVERSLDVAGRVREEFSTFVHVGIGGSDLGPRVCHEVLDSPHHNELGYEARGAPRMYFEGDTFDPRPLRELLELLRERGELDATAVNVVSKSGRTPETLCTLLAIKEQLGDATWSEQVVLTTGEDAETSNLYRLTEDNEFLGVLPVPEGVGGRFSVPSPVGLLPLAVSANEKVQKPQERVEQALEGFGEGHERMMLSTDCEDNIAFRLARWLQFAEEQLGISTLVFYDYSGCRMLGDWLVQLYAESIQERGGGLNIIAARGPTSNHSLLNGIINGPRDKIVLFVKWEDLGEDVAIPVDESVGDELRSFMGTTMKTLQDASCQGTITDFTRNGIPSLVLSVPSRGAYHLFLVMRILMDTVAIKGRLQGLHIGADSAIDFASELTYRQDGVEGYKQATREIL